MYEGKRVCVYRVCLTPTPGSRLGVGVGMSVKSHPAAGSHPPGGGEESGYLRTDAAEKLSVPVTGPGQGAGGEGGSNEGGRCEECTSWFI